MADVASPMMFIAFLLLGCAISGTVGFVLGYALGRRTAERQGAFPVIPVEEAGAQSGAKTGTRSSTKRDTIL